MSISPDGKYKIVLNQVGDPGFPFGLVKARVVLTCGEKKLETYDTEVWDDGANLAPHSWSVVWDDYSVTVIFRGSEQEPETICRRLAD